MPVINEFMPAYECGNLLITAWPDPNYSYDKINLTIARETQKSAGKDIKDVYDATWKRSDLITKLQGDSIENVLRNVNFTKEEFSLMENEKEGIIKYLEDVKDIFEGSKKTQLPAP
jgi:hypothetical protein